MKIPSYVHFGGRAWFPDLAVYRTIPTRVWPVVDVVADNYGTGVIIRIGGGTELNNLDVVIEPEWEGEV